MHNKDLIEGVQVLVTMDNRTSHICIARSMMAWKLTGEPIEATGATGKFPGPPPYHYNCRSTLIPYLRPLTDFIKSKKLSDAQKDRINQIWNEDTQSSMDGPVSSKLNYEQWLKTKPVDFQKDVLGPGRWKLWSEGKLNASDLIDQSGNSISLKDLAKRSEAPLQPDTPTPPPMEMAAFQKLMEDKGVKLAMGQDRPEALYEEFRSIFGNGWNEFVSSYVDVIDSFEPGSKLHLNMARWQSSPGVTTTLSMRLSDLKTFDDVLTRKVFVQEGMVYNELFDLPDRFQGKGLAKKVLAKQFKSYRLSTGIEQVDVTAGLTAGGYTWARFGFLPSQKDWQKLLIAAMDDNIESISKLATHLTRSQVGPEGLWSIADHPEGRRFLAGRGWAGVFDFNNPDQVARFEAYVGVDLPKKAVK